MKDIYEFLICTLFASLPAIYVLIIKNVLRDKLTPLWQFSLWAVLGVALIIPVNSYPFLSLLAESIKTFLSDTVSVSRPTLSIPFFPTKLPETADEYLYVTYFAGFFVMLIKYAYSLLKLKLILRKCPEADENTLIKVRDTAMRYKLPLCKIRILKGINSPFICGIISPVLVLPEGETDEKIILHELLHLKYKDVLWGIPIALYRCIHWCNPFLWYCFNKINNDIEELCDARVISLLDGEERREYGNIILSMANGKYASLPGTSSIANGGKNIRSRIETIARFKQYPQGNTVVSLCIIALLVSSLFVPGAAAIVPDSFTEADNNTSLLIALSAARSYYCTTPAGAIDTYAYSVINKDVVYRAFSAPLELHKDIEKAVRASISNDGEIHYPEFTLGNHPYGSNNYYVYNLTQTAKNQYSAYIVINAFSNELSTDNYRQVAYQKIKIFREYGRWVVLPERDFEYAVTYRMMNEWGCRDLPAVEYTASTELFDVIAGYQTCLKISPKNNYGTPVRNAYFSEIYVNKFTECIYTGDENNKENLHQLGLAVKSFSEDTSPETDEIPSHGNYSSSSSDGSSSASVTLVGNWGNRIDLSGGGYTTDYKKGKSYYPEKMTAALYLNSELYTELVLERKD